MPSPQVDAAANDLRRPLGRPSRTPGGAGRAVRTWAWRGLVAAAIVVVLAFVGAALYGDPKGGRPIAWSDITARPASVPSPPVTAVPSPAAEAPSGRPGSRDAETIEARSGVTVVRPPGSSAPASIVVAAPAAQDGLPRAPDERLVERTRAGLLPKVGPDGARPIDVYARKPGELPGGARPAGRVAVVVGGLGISRTMTGEAIARLPAAVSLAFAPYGTELDRAAEAARGAGHEILLQVPMEPFDYPDSDPGPRTLTTGARPGENTDNLQWALGRFTGYVAVMNYMGAKLTADDRMLQPILHEVGQRGLGFLDDGSSSRSRVTALAGGTRAGRAEAVLDAAPRPDLIDRALERLEQAARGGGGIAIGTASALPMSIDRIARWAQGLEAKGILLVPVSAALTARPSVGGQPVAGPSPGAAMQPVPGPQPSGPQPASGPQPSAGAHP